jgi:hypothetical protein
MTIHADICASYTKSERLPFTVSLVKTEAQMKKAISIRQEAYARHLPEFAQTLQVAEPSDTQPGTFIFLAESKLDGTALGTMRVQSNEHLPLDLEHSVQLPSRYQGKRLLESSRLGVTAGSVGSVVKHALIKAGYLLCLQNDIDYMVLTARAPVDRHYMRLMFEDVFEDKCYIPIKHIQDIPHRILSYDIAKVRERLIGANHPLKGFYIETHHPDILVGAVAPGTPSRTTNERTESEMTLA